jgi:hypothetical protein
MTGSAAFSNVMQLNFDDGIVREHEYIIKTPFVAIPEGEDGPCHRLSNCSGWSLEGDYSVATNFEGSSSLEIEALVHKPSDFDLDSMYGVGWGFGFGSNSMFDQTESYLALYSW